MASVHEGRDGRGLFETKEKSHEQHIHPLNGTEGPFVAGTAIEILSHAAGRRAAAPEMRAVTDGRGLAGEYPLRAGAPSHPGAEAVSSLEPAGRASGPPFSSGEQRKGLTVRSICFASVIEFASVRRGAWRILCETRSYSAASAARAFLGAL